MSREVVFVHVPKTGGLSILPICYHHGIRVIEHNIRKKGNMSLADYKAMNPTCFAFAFVRNPWDRVVSAFFYLKSGGANEDDRRDGELYLPYEDFNTFVYEAFKTDKIFEQMHFKPQYFWLSNGEKLLIDSYGHYENLEETFRKHCNLFGLPEYKLPHLNKTEHEYYKKYYAKDTWKIVYEAYEKDIRLFGYDCSFSSF